MRVLEGSGRRPGSDLGDSLCPLARASRVPGDAVPAELSVAAPRSLLNIIELKDNLSEWVDSFIMIMLARAMRHLQSDHSHKIQSAQIGLNKMHSTLL